MIHTATHKLIRIVVIFAASAVIMWVPTAHAQIPGVGDPIIFETFPTSPLPNTAVTVRAKSFTLDFNRASLSWNVNGAVLAQGIGVTEITFTLGDIGSVATVRLTATEAGTPYTSELSIRATSVDILWQADTYTPPLYRGKALPSSGATIRFVAIPDIRVGGQRILSSNLIYTWKDGSRVLGNLSGIGRSSIELPAPRLTGQGNVSVAVETADKSVRALGFADVRSVYPRLVFYENDPLLGIRYEQAIGENFDLKQEEVVIVAHPYYFVGQDRVHPRATYSWQVSNRDVENPLEDKSSIVLRQTGGSGNASISLSIEHLDEVLQRAREHFTITFSGAERPAF